MIRKIKTLTVTFLLVALYLVSQVTLAWYHSFWISSGIWPSHTWSAVLGAGAAMVISFLWMVLAGGKWLQVLFLLVLLLSLRWIVFDISLNYFRDLSLSYIGLPDRHDAFLDTMPAALHFGLKALLIVFSFWGFAWSLRR